LLTKCDVVSAWKDEFDVAASKEEIVKLITDRITKARSGSTDNVVKVGAVLIKPDLSMMSACNFTKYPSSFPKGFWDHHDANNYDGIAVRKSDVVVHAEERLIFNAKQVRFLGDDSSWDEALLVTTTFPCAKCISMILELTGISFLWNMNLHTISTPAKQDRAREVLKWFNDRQERTITYGEG